MKPEFEPIQDIKIIERYLQYALDTSETISLYVPTGDLRFTGRIKKTLPSLSLELEVDPRSFGDFDTIRTTFRANDVHQIRLSFSLNDVYFFANTDLVEVQSTHLLLTILTPVFKLQRRNAQRFKVTEGFHCILQIGDMKFTPFDLSATGTSILFPTSGLAAFKKKDMIKGANLTFQNSSVSIDLEVCNFEKQKTDEMTKVGFRFLNLPNIMEQEIAKEAYLYTRKIWARWL